uniref:Uncharacterized protein n=1 Tax=Tetraselmis sp. GSL018 TaxID=582737 RepID=A0A061S014_9CHLO
MSLLWTNRHSISRFRLEKLVRAEVSPRALSATLSFRTLGVFPQGCQIYPQQRRSFSCPSVSASGHYSSVFELADQLRSLDADSSFDVSCLKELFDIQKLDTAVYQTQILKDRYKAPSVQAVVSVTNKLTLEQVQNLLVDLHVQTTLLV